MGGSELTYASNVFTAGYVVSQLPAVILVTKIRPSYIIPTLEILWSVFTFCSSAVKNVPQLYAMRFLVGLCEGAFFPTIIYLISSWYTKVERGKRVTLFYSTTMMSSMFSGYLQAGAYNGLSGRLGHAGWQWLFIICGIISLPVGVIGFLFNPDFRRLFRRANSSPSRRFPKFRDILDPEMIKKLYFWIMSRDSRFNLFQSVADICCRIAENTRAFYLTKEEAAFARQRLLNDGYKPLGASAWNKKKLFKIVISWQFWVLSFGYFFVQCSFPTQQPFYALYLKATSHSVYQINVWPTGQAAIGLVTQVLAGMISDSPLLRGRRWQAILALQGPSIFGCIVLAIWNVPIGLKYFAFYISWTSAGVPGIYYAWFPDLMPHDHEMRGFLTAFSNMFSFINQIWWQDAVWRTSEAPEFKPAFIGCAAFGVVLILTALLMRWLELRDVKERATIEQEDAGDAGNVVETPEKSVDNGV